MGEVSGWVVRGDAWGGGLLEVGLESYSQVRVGTDGLMDT